MTRRDPYQPMFGSPMTPWWRWFAWRPIRTLDRGWVWLRPVWRRRCLIAGYLALEPHGPDTWLQHVIDRQGSE